MVSPICSILLFRVETVLLFRSFRKNVDFLAHAVKVHVVSIDDSNLTGVSLAIKEKCAVEAVAVSVCLDQLSQRGFPPR